MRKVCAANVDTSAVIGTVVADDAGSETSDSLQNQHTSANASILVIAVLVDFGGNERHRASSYEDASTSSRIDFHWRPSVPRPAVGVDFARRERNRASHYKYASTASAVYKYCIIRKNLARGEEDCSRRYQSASTPSVACTSRLKIAF
jgi:hypothetical protein